MKLLSKCQACHKKRLYVAKRVFNVKNVGEITSQNLICNECKNKMVKMLGDQIQ